MPSAARKFRSCVRRSHARSAPGAPVAPARERGAAGALEHQVAAPPQAGDDLAEEQGAAVAELRGEAPELVTGVRLRDRFGSLGNLIPGKNGGAVRAAQQLGGQAQLTGQLAVEEQQARRGDRGGLPGDGEPREVPRVGVVKPEEGGHTRQSDAFSHID